MYFWKQNIIAFLNLFTSFGTLICCALPALFVTLGAGAALAGLVSSMPWLIPISEHKIWVFTIAGIMLAGTGVLRYINRHAPCPVDPVAANACSKARKVGGILFWFSVLVYAIGFFFAFIAAKILGA